MNLTYPKTIQFLYGLRLFGTKLGLENAHRLAALAGNPHQELRFIHVAGTNGKGSTCAMLESIYRSAGLRVGLFTSPHLVSFRERIQVNRQLISEPDVVRLVEQMQSSLEQFPAGGHPTFFEVVTVMALRYFLEQRCDLVIWETGLGGRLDATNIVKPLASVITNINLDHEQWLGGALSQIASEKAGIIKPGVPVITAADQAPAMEVIRNTAAQNHSPLTHITAADSLAPPMDKMQLPLLGDHQRLNAALAVTTVQIAGKHIPLDNDAVRRGLERVSWPGRLQFEQISPNRAVLLDGAHNPAGAQALRAALERHFPAKRPTLILGILRDKDWRKMCQILAPLARRVLLAPVQSERALAPLEMELVCREIDSSLDVASFASLAQALDEAKQEPFVVISGSLHFVGEALESLNLVQASPGERGLNEWDASAAGQLAAK